MARPVCMLAAPADNPGHAIPGRPIFLLQDKTITPTVKESLPKTEALQKRVPEKRERAGPA